MEFIKAGKLESIKEGEVTSVETRIGRIGLTRIKDEILAFQDGCTHDDAPLNEGELEGEEITCPRHGAVFNIRSGEALQMPATEDIEVYPVRINGDDVEVDIG